MATAEIRYHVSTAGSLAPSCGSAAQRLRFANPFFRSSPPPSMPHGKAAWRGGRLAFSLDVSIHSRPIRRLTPQPTDRGRADCPSLKGGGYGKGFHRLRRLVNYSFPPEGGGLKPQRNF